MIDIFPPPTIHLTDACNERCSFCIASSSMPQSTKKQISFADFKTIADSFAEQEALSVKLTGGETTLHADFESILSYALQKFLAVTIFTNGTFPTVKRNVLKKYGNRLILIFNLPTPGFQTNSQTRNLVLGNIKSLYRCASVSLSVVSLFLDDTVGKTFDWIDKKILKEVHVKLSFQNPIAFRRNEIRIEDFPHVGENICSVISAIEKKAKPKAYDFEGWMRPCMFSACQKAFMKKRGVKYYYNLSTCHPVHTHSHHIASDLSTFHCYPLSPMHQYHISPKTVRHILKKYEKIEKDMRKRYILPACRACIYFGTATDRCSGPCIAFRINSLLADKKIRYDEVI